MEISSQYWSFSCHQSWLDWISRFPPPLPAITTFFYPVFSPSFHRISIESVDHFLRNMGMGKPGNNCGSAQKKSKEVAFLRLRSGRGLLSWFTEETRQEPGNVVFLSDIYLCALWGAAKLCRRGEEWRSFLRRYELPYRTLQNGLKQIMFRCH